MTADESGEARTPREVLNAFHRCLNHSALVPPKAYRRNSNLYPLVGYVNTVVGALLSENYELVPLFVERAAEHMSQNPPLDEAVHYYSLVSSYLSHVVHFTGALGLRVQFDPTRINPTILNAGPQAAPQVPSTRASGPATPRDA